MQIDDGVAVVLTGIVGALSQIIVAHIQKSAETQKKSTSISHNLPASTAPETQTKSGTQTTSGTQVEPVTQATPSTPPRRTRAILMLVGRTRAILMLVGACVFVISAVFFILIIPKNKLSANVVEHFGFERSRQGWEKLRRCSADWSNCQFDEAAAQTPSGPIDRGVAYDLYLAPGAWIDSQVRYENPVKADIVTAQLYIPDNPAIVYNWVALEVVDERDQVLTGSYGRIPTGEWTTLTLDLRQKYDATDTPLKQRPLFLQVNFSLQSQSNIRPETIQVGLDDVTWYVQTGDERISEQRGPGRAVFDFENEVADGWLVNNQAATANTLQITGEPTYRGRKSLKVATKLIGGGDNYYLNTTWPGTNPPSGWWIAQVYLPDTASPKAEVWANLFTYDKAGWKNSETETLKPGQWTTIVWDTRQLEWAAGAITLGIQFGAEGDSYEGPIYVDDIQILAQ